MTVAAVKEKLHNYINQANGKKAKALLDRAKNSETHIEQLPDITRRFTEI